MPKIGVFDSGRGGESVAVAIEQAFPESEVVFRNDIENLPYGVRTQEELLGLVVPILQLLELEGCDCIVIACNTVTTTIISSLREIITIPLIGIEPMVKPASLMTKSNIIAVCATPTTLSSPRYAALKQEFAADITVLQPNCSNWAFMIEHAQVDTQEIVATINEVCNKGADVIVLACTHYHWIEQLIKETAGNRTIVIQPEQAIVAQLGRILATLGY